MSARIVVRTPPQTWLGVFNESSQDYPGPLVVARILRTRFLKAATAVGLAHRTVTVIMPPRSPILPEVMTVTIRAVTDRRTNSVKTIWHSNTDVPFALAVNKTTNRIYVMNAGSGRSSRCVGDI
jgi:hypothetical protein